MSISDFVAEVVRQLGDDFSVECAVSRYGSIYLRVKVPKHDIAFTVRVANHPIGKGERHAPPDVDIRYKDKDLSWELADYVASAITGEYDSIVESREK